MRRSCLRASLLVFTILGVAACSKHTPLDPASVQKLKERSLTDEARFGALISNRGSYQADLDRKYPQIWKGLQIDRQIPTGLKRAGLVEAIVTHARNLGLKAEVQLGEPSASTATLPARVGPNEAIPWRDETVLFVLPLTLRLTPPDLGQTERWFETRQAIGRRLEIVAVRISARGAEIDARAFAFRDDLPLPERVQPPFDFDAMLRAVGLPRSAPDTEPRLAAARGRYDALERLRPQINQALRLRTQAERLDERYQRFVTLTKRCDAQRWLEVLR